MPLAASVLLVTSMTLAGADPEAERVIGRLRDHFERLHSIHIRAVDRKLKAGGLWTQNPAEEKPVYDPSFTREYDIWFDPPKIRLFQTGIYHPAGGAQETSRVAIYFDGSKYTHLDMISRSGFQIKGGSHLQPPITGPLHALGYCFPMTYGTSLGQLLTNPSQLEV